MNVSLLILCSTKQLEAAVEERTDTKNTKKNNSLHSNFADRDQKRSSSAKLLKFELNNLLQKSPTQVHLNKVSTDLLSDMFMYYLSIIHSVLVYLITLLMKAYQ